MLNAVKSPKSNNFMELLLQFVSSSQRSQKRKCWKRSSTLTNLRQPIEGASWKLEGNEQYCLHRACVWREFDGTWWSQCSFSQRTARLYHLVDRRISAVILTVGTRCNDDEVFCEILNKPSKTTHNLDIKLNTSMCYGEPIVSSTESMYQWQSRKCLSDELCSFRAPTFLGFTSFLLSSRATPSVSPRRQYLSVSECVRS